MVHGDPGVNFNIGNQTWVPPYQAPPKRCTCHICPCCGGQIPTVGPYVSPYHPHWSPTVTYSFNG